MLVDIFFADTGVDHLAGMSLCSNLCRNGRPLFHYEPLPHAPSSAKGSDIHQKDEKSAVDAEPLRHTLSATGLSSREEELTHKLGVFAQLDACWR